MSYPKQISGLSFEVVSSAPEQFGAFVHDEIARWTEVMRGAGIQDQ
jgi:tripartite-type tricarboxylate transporter receptor subunit TctC